MYLRSFRCRFLKGKKSPATNTGSGASNLLRETGGRAYCSTISFSSIILRMLIRA